MLTRDVTPEECGWLDKTYAKHDLVYKYIGYTYGCIADGIACSEEPDKTPFFELPADAVTSVVEKVEKEEPTPIPKQKPVYKIWNKRRKEYVGGYNSKKQWASLRWAIEAAKRNQVPALGRGELEIHTLELRVVERMDPNPEIQRKKEEAARKEKIRQEKAQKRKVAESFLQGLLPGEPVWNIVKLYDRGAFNEKLMAKMKEGIEIFKENS